MEQTTFDIDGKMKVSVKLVLISEVIDSVSVSVKANSTIGYVKTSVKLDCRKYYVMY